MNLQFPIWWSYQPTNDDLCWTYSAQTDACVILWVICDSITASWICSNPIWWKIFIRVVVTGRWLAHESWILYKLQTCEKSGQRMDLSKEMIRNWRNLGLCISFKEWSMKISNHLRYYDKMSLYRCMGVANIQKSSDFRSCNNPHYCDQASDVLNWMGSLIFLKHLWPEVKSASCSTLQVANQIASCTSTKPEVKSATLIW